MKKITIQPMNLPSFDKPRKQQPVLPKQKQAAKPALRQYDYGRNISHLKAIQKEEW